MFAVFLFLTDLKNGSNGMALSFVILLVVQKYEAGFKMHVPLPDPSQRYGSLERICLGV